MDTACNLFVKRDNDSREDTEMRKTWGQDSREKEKAENRVSRESIMAPLTSPRFLNNFEPRRHH